jgi:phosphoesterase RecJ-like protein
MHRIAQQIHEVLLKANKIVLVPHTEPDGDALGAVNAMFEYLTNFKKNVIIYSSGQIPNSLEFLPHHQSTNLNETVLQDEEIDVVVALDCGDYKRTKIRKYLDNRPTILINIDHHATNDHFGQLNMVIADASSTAEIIYKFFRYNNITINKNIATALLTGILTDTDNFSNSATTPLSLAIAGEMAQKGANFKMINQHTRQNKSLDIFKLWGIMLARLKKHEPLNMAYTYLTLADFTDTGITHEEGLDIADFLNNLQETKISLVLKELPEGRVKGSFRTTHHDIDVSKLAKIMGGGGHIKAAGFTMDGTLTEIMDKILTIDKKNTIL